MLFTQCSRSSWFALAGVACILLIGARSARADIINVPGDYDTIQEAIEAAAPTGDEIIVAPDTYHEAIDFLGKAIHLHSSGGVELTTIDASDLETSVVICISGEGPDTILEGFTITGGVGTPLPDYRYGGGMLSIASSPTVRGCIFANNQTGEAGDSGGGGGMCNLEGSSPTVIDCIFIANISFSYDVGGMLNGYHRPALTELLSRAGSFPVSGAGGGMCNLEGSGPTVLNCTFVSNAASYGAGMYNDGESAPAIIDCTFEQNESQYSDGGMSNQHSDPTVRSCTFIENHGGYIGGGMGNWSGNPLVVDCTFSNNAAWERGGAMSNYQSDSTVIDCAFEENEAGYDWGGKGGGMHNDGESSPIVVNCSFAANIADSGGGIFNYGSNAPGGSVVVNCTFADNAAATGPAVACEDSSRVVIANCILWNGGGEVWINDGSVVTITYSCIDGGYEGVGNINTDPLFVDPDHGDYHLSPGSPCIDAGANNALPADALDLDDDGDTVERVPIDLDGNPRFADDPDTADSGCGAPVIVDMGAYEFPGEAWHPMRIGDVDGNGAVNTADLLMLLAAWGGYEDGCVLGDLDYSGAVDTADLLVLLANWG